MHFLKDNTLFYIDGHLFSNLMLKELLDFVFCILLIILCVLKFLRDF